MEQCIYIAVAQAVTARYEVAGGGHEVLARVGQAKRSAIVSWKKSDCPWIVRYLVVLRPPGFVIRGKLKLKLAVSPPRLCRAMAKIHKQAAV